MNEEAKKVIESCKGRTLGKAVAAVNEWVNRSIGYIPPPPEWNFNRWKSPERTLAEGKANCLDAAVLKMAILFECGADPDLLSIGMTHSHAVLVFKYPHKSWCLGKPVVKDWIADINPPYFYRRETNPRYDTWKREPFTFDEVQSFVAFDEETYFKEKV